MGITAMDQGLRDTARAAFWQGFNSIPSLFEGIASVEPSNSDQETYAWLGYAAPVREFGAQRVKQGVPQVTYSIVNKKWEATVVFDYMIRKYGRNNVVSKNVAQMGQKAREHRDTPATRTVPVWGRISNNHCLAYNCGLECTPKGSEPNE